ncbi:Lon protease C-terminal proteolytic domain-containing protein [Globomyces pollinis-pini]|nr:Lon protease C-terminal proteolytic domain-containing protein [Globomyces pollinis-pini]
MSVVIPNQLPVLPTNNNRVLLPGVVVRLLIQRQDSLQLLDSISDSQPFVAVIPLVANKSKKKKDAKFNKVLTAFDGSLGVKLTDPIKTEDLFGWGTVARIADFKVDSKKNYIITLEGIARFKVSNLTTENSYYIAKMKVYPEEDIDVTDVELAATVQTFRQGGNELVEALKELKLPMTILKQLTKMLDSSKPGQLADLLASMIDLSYEEKLDILKTHELRPRLLRLIELITRQLQVFKISQKLTSNVESKLGEKQREYLLREQLEAIKKELGETDETDDSDLNDLTKKLSNAVLPEETKKVCDREMKRLRRMQPNMSEYQVTRNYLEWVLDLPWDKSSIDQIDIKHARDVLNADHYGLEKVKSRIIEYLSIRKLKRDMRGPILCLVGAPGVGKTSLGKSIANALGRKFYRISLGGVRDEAEIRGHRRTYIGSMPGLIIQAIRRTGVNNPVILLDEIDKLCKDSRGDPSSALLEVLDPEQNSTFSDHYINIPFDLSKVLFIATANEMDPIPAPLMDRMVFYYYLTIQELLQLSGYTIDEKLNIARKYLLPKQTLQNGLKPNFVQMTDTILETIIAGYTREAGVRNLEREIGAVCRSLAVEYSEALDSKQDRFFKPQVSKDRLSDILGPIKFEEEISERTNYPGVVTGLAWTSSGSGGVLFIEASQSPGTGKLLLTGKLGDVIKESAQLGMTYVRANAAQLGIISTSLHCFEKIDVHIHFPAGATPKDGPSAGVTIVTALVSMLTKKPIRPFTGMTGEMTLRGLVLPVGGIKEKILAAHRHGLKRVIIPYRNRKDLVDIPLNIQRELDIVYCKNIMEVMAAADLLSDSHVILDAHL